ncbi:MAG: DUF935 family protein [Magnetococcales bacterium]|nr:DUF935 family protein [Magnetococcales bacterium]
MAKKSKNTKKSRAIPKTIRQEIATTRDGRDITRPYNTLGILQPQDPVLQAQGGGDYTVYEELLRDDQVASTFQQRRLAVTAAPWEVKPGADDKPSRLAAELIEETLDRIGWDNVTDKMLYGVFYGYAVAECLWASDGRLFTLDEIKVRKQKRFVFDLDDNPRLLTLQNQLDGEPLPEKKFWHFRTGGDNDDEPYGLGLAHHLFWPVFLKTGNSRLWLSYIDRFGSPTTLGRFPSGTTDAEKQNLLSALEKIRSDSGVVIPEEMRIDLLEASRSGSPGHGDFYDRMDAAIAKVVLSQTMTTDAAGGQYKAEVHKAVRNEVVKADADLVCASFNKSVVRWLTGWNFSNATPPIVSRITEEAEDLDSRSERDGRLFGMGFRPTLEQVRETYGGEWEDVSEGGESESETDASPAISAQAGIQEGEEGVEKQEKTPEKSVDFADDCPGGSCPVPSATDPWAYRHLPIDFADPAPPADPGPDEIKKQAAALLGQAIASWGESIESAIKTATDPDALRAAIFQAYPRIDAADFAEIVAAASLYAELRGRIEVMEEDSNDGA